MGAEGQHGIFPRCLLAAFTVLALVAAPARLASAANLDTTADRFFGQPNFHSNGIHNPSLSAHSLFQPAGVALDLQGNLYVADIGNNRLLEYDQPAPFLRVLLPLILR